MTHPPAQRDLFDAPPPPARRTERCDEFDARRSESLTPFEFSDEGCVPSDAPIPEWLRLPFEEN